eukprot:101046_1
MDSRFYCGCLLCHMICISTTLQKTSWSKRTKPDLSHSSIAMAPSLVTLLTIHLISLTILISIVYAETLTNPSQGTYHCGLTTNCTVICDTRNGCLNSTFHVYNNTVSIQCIDDDACTSITVIAHHVKQLNITATGRWRSMANSHIMVDSTNTDVYTVCGTISDGSEITQCEDTTFHYQNHGKTTHICKSQQACQFATIHTATAIDLYCYLFARGAPGGCSYWTTVIWPTDPLAIQQSKFIHYSDTPDKTSGPMVFVVPNTQYTPNIQCLGAGGCVKWDLQTIYGITSSDYVSLYKGQGNMSSIETHNDVLNASTFISDFYRSGWTYEFEHNTLFIISHQSAGSIEFKSINNARISVLCIAVDEFTFIFSSVADVAIAYIGEVSNIDLYGPTSSFISNSPVASVALSQDITMYLRNTPHVVFNGLPVGASYTGSYNIYLDKQTNVVINHAINDIDCFDCVSFQVIFWSTISVNQQSLETYGWQIECSQSAIDTCIRFMFNPTMNPTTEPTVEPTTEPTGHPSNGPSARTVAPSGYPTWYPSGYPSKSPFPLLHIIPTPPPTSMETTDVIIYDTLPTNDVEHNTESAHVSSKDKGLITVIYILVIAWIVTLIVCIYAIGVCMSKRRYESNQKSDQVVIQAGQALRLSNPDIDIPLPPEKTVSNIAIPLPPGKMISASEGLSAALKASLPDDTEMAILKADSDEEDSDLDALYHTTGDATNNDVLLPTEKVPLQALATSEALYNVAVNASLPEDSELAILKADSDEEEEGDIDGLYQNVTTTENDETENKID